MKVSSNARRYARYARIVILPALLLPSVPLAAHAQSCPNGNLTECTRYRKLVQDVKSNDPPTALAALKSASQDLDPSLRSLVYGIALKSSDMTLRTAAVRYIISGRSFIDVQLELPPHPSDAQQQLYQRNPVLHFRGVKVDDKSDEIAAVAGANRLTGNFVRGGFEMTFFHCQLRLTGGEADALRGTLQCAEGKDGVVVLDASLDLS